jgi:hypothetical protein
MSQDTQGEMWTSIAITKEGISIAETLDQKPARHYTDGDLLGLHANIAEEEA